MNDTTIHIIPVKSVTKPFRVYLAINTTNGHIYVGKESGYLFKRRDLHFAEARRGSKRAFASALNEFGFGAFSFVYVFQTDNEEDANNQERKLIAQLHTHVGQGGAGYNMSNGSQGGCRWTFEEVQKIALRYKERLHWAKGHSASYYSARYHGWLDRVTVHMKTNQQTWTRSAILECANRSKTMFEFKKKNRKAYDAARQRNMLSEIAAKKIKSKANIGTPVMMDDTVFFISLAEAARSIGSFSANILACVEGRRRSAKGHWFRLATAAEIAAHGYSSQFSDHIPPTIAAKLRASRSPRGKNAISK